MFAIVGTGAGFKASLGLADVLGICSDAGVGFVTFSCFFTTFEGLDGAV